MQNIAVGPSGSNNSLFTSDATPTPLFDVPIDANALVSITLHVGARSSGDEKAWQIAVAASRRGLSAPTILGAPLALSTLGTLGAALWDVGLSISGNSLRATVTGALLTSIEWGACYDGAEYEF